MIPESGIMERRHQGMSPGSAALSPSLGYRSALFARRCFSYLTPFLPFSPLRSLLLRLLWTALKINWRKKMWIDNTALKLARFIHIMLRKSVLNSWQFSEYFGIFLTAWSHRAFQKNPPLYLRKNLLATARNLKVNEQSKYKSVPIFFIPS